MRASRRTPCEAPAPRPRATTRARAPVVPKGVAEWVEGAQGARWHRGKGGAGGPWNAYVEERSAVVPTRPGRPRDSCPVPPAPVSAFDECHARRRSCRSLPKRRGRARSSASPARMPGSARFSSSSCAGRTGRSSGCARWRSRRARATPSAYARRWRGSARRTCTRGASSSRGRVGRGDRWSGRTRRGSREALSGDRQADPGWRGQRRSQPPGSRHGPPVSYRMASSRASQLHPSSSMMHLSDVPLLNCTHNLAVATRVPDRHGFPAWTAGSSATCSGP